MSGDGREEPVYRPSGGGMDEGTKRLAIIAGAIGFVLLVVVGGWSLRGHGGAGGGSVPVIEPDPTPIKVKPADPGGMQLSGAEPPPANEDDGHGPSLAPGPETPDPAALQAELDRARKAVTPAPTPAATSAAPPASVVRTAPPAASAAAAAAATPTPAPAAAAPPATPEPAAPPTPTHAAPSHAAAGGVAVQLAALDTEEAAHQQWSRLVHRAPALFEGRTPLVLEASRDGKTFWRLRIGGFPTIAAATEFCERVRATGAACTIATF